MHKRNREFSQKIFPKLPRYGRRKSRGALPLPLAPAAVRLGLIGFPVLLAGLGDIALRLHRSIQGGEAGIMLRLGYDVECIAAGLCILTGGMLLLDYMERREKG